MTIVVCYLDHAEITLSKSLLVGLSISLSACSSPLSISLLVGLSISLLACPIIGLSFLFYLRDRS